MNLAVHSMNAPAPLRAGRVRDEAAVAAERELVRQAQRGNVAAYEELARQHQQRIFAVASGVLRRNEDLEDIAQQVLLKVYVSLKRFDLRSSFSTWLYKVTVNECLDYLRKKKVRKLVYEADMSEEQAEQWKILEDAGEARPISASRRVELRQLVDGLLAHLPEVEQLMLVLKEVEGLTVEEIGEALNMNVNTVKVRMFRARGKLVSIYRRRMGGKEAGRVSRAVAGGRRD
jgi:RNA polymerase sigma-70 factor (ECF subfamily)